MTGTISNIQNFSIHDGPGIRTTVFLQGCPLSCLWCHNPECIAVDGNGKDYSTGELLKEILKDRTFFEESGGGVTFSGGEPLMQINFLTELLSACNKEGIHTAVDTSGFAERTTLEKAIPHTDLFLYDLKLIDDELHRKYTGVSNRKILENLQFLDKSSIPLQIRIPLIPGITDTNENLQEIILFIKSLNTTYKPELLPYHKMAEGKYDRLHLDYRLKGVEQSEERLEEIRKIFDIY